MTTVPAHSLWRTSTAGRSPSALAVARSRVVSAMRFVGLRVSGIVLAFLSVVLLSLGWALNWMEFVYAGLLGGVVFLVAMVCTLGRPRYAVRLSLDKPSVVVGQQVSGTIEVINRSKRASFASRMDVPVSKERVSFGVPWLRSGAGHLAMFDVPTDRRSVVLVGPAQSIQGDPFGLSGRSAVWTDELELYVHPVTIPLPGRQAGFIHDLEGHSTSKLADSDMSFHALREYVPGDDRRHIHWKSSARAGRLMIRQFEETLQSRVCVALDVAEDSYSSLEGFELAVSAGASVVLQSFREENPLGLLTSSEIIQAISPTRALDEMCRIEPTTNTSAVDVIQVVLDHEPNASVVVWITGDKVSQLTVQQASAKLAADVRVIAIRVDQGSKLRVQAISNVTYIELTELAELPRAMRRALQ